MISYFMQQVLPNLIADALWVPLVWLSHRRILQHIKRHALMLIPEPEKQDGPVS
jgi:hypothetical protein